MDKINEKFSFQVKLECQSPIIHFQHNRDGATLRATEVKPKLDKFLIKKYGKENIPKNWYAKSTTDQKSALDYKMRFMACNAEKDTGEKDAVSSRPHKIYYGNLGDGPKKQALYGNCEVEIICFHTDLKDFIKDNLTEFFVVTNFGTMQGKGFGSFLPVYDMAANQPIKKPTEIKIGEWLCKNYNATVCYKINGTYFGNKAFNEIKTISSQMKSFGYYTIEKYYNTKNIKSIKQLKSKKDDGIGTYRYTRAVFGIGSSIANLTMLPHEEIERFPFPIFFKIINDEIYFVAKRIDDIIYDKEFKFKGSKPLSTPKKTEKISVDEYLEWFRKRNDSYKTKMKPIYTKAGDNQ